MGSRSLNIIQRRQKKSSKEKTEARQQRRCNQLSWKLLKGTCYRGLDFDKFEANPTETKLRVSKSGEQKIKERERGVINEG